jgi:dipeptidyl aminopeptidase/acylaminoacyl peptidase
MAKTTAAGILALLFGGLVATSIATAAPVGAPAGFTVEQVMSAPFASELVASKDGRAVAWVVDEEGARNVWTASAPDWVGRRLTARDRDDGQELGQLRFSPDGRLVAFVLGGEPNGKGEFPNPTSDPAGTEQAVFVVPSAGGEPRKLGLGEGPRIAPAGDRVVFVKDGQVQVAALDGSAEPTPLFKARGDASELAWSPDGSRLAFVSGRGNHSFVGVYDLAAKQVRWMDPSTDRDFAPVFSPDGKQVAFLRVPADPRAYPFVPARAGPPWQGRVADTASGRGRLVWAARPGRGSVFRELGSSTQLFWAAGDRLVFPWEADGWTHLYSVPSGGGPGVLLTPGDFEVEHATLSLDRASVVYSSNQDDVDRRHVWQVPAGGGVPHALTRGEGIEWSPVALEGGRAAVLHSDAHRSSRAAAVTADGSLHDLGGPRPEGFPADQLVVPQAVVFPAADGLPIHGQLFLPPAGSAGSRRPAVVFFHGGSVRQMLLGWHYMQYYHNTYAFNQYLAGHGYVVLSVNYRSGIGYGLEFREALGYGAGGASEFQDVLGAGLYLRGREDVDPGRIGLWGGSYGGYLTALGLARASSLFAAGVDLHGVHDWNVVIRNFAPSYDPLARPERARLAFESSPMASVDTWRSPVLLVHGDDDRNVPFSETVDLAVALRKKGVDFEELVFPDEIHDFLLTRSWVRAFEAASAFFDRRLAAP